MLNRVLVVCESHKSQLVSSTLNAITAGSKIGPVDVFVTGSSADVAEQVSGYQGVSKVYYAQHETAFEHNIAENLSNAVSKFLELGEHSHIIAPSSSVGKDFLPRVAAQLDVPMISDCVEIVNESLSVFYAIATFKRPVYASELVLTVSSSYVIFVYLRASPVVMSVLPTGFDAAEPSDSRAELFEFTESFDVVDSVSHVSDQISESSRPDLDATAKIVVSGGRGVASAENFEKVIYPLADKLGAAVGASRAAVDEGFCPNDMQVGQTGKKVAPALYVAVGISGAIQHVAGMQKSKTIVAINKDPEAPIFQVADYGLVADLFQAVPELEGKL